MHETRVTPNPSNPPYCCQNIDSQVADVVGGLVVASPGPEHLTVNLHHLGGTVNYM